VQGICEICGAEYEKTRSNQKYCPECGRNPKAAARRYREAVRTNKLHAGEYDIPKVWTCKQCGKEILAIYKKSFCSDACQKEYVAQNAECSECHRKLIEVGIRRTYFGLAFCSDACREKAQNRRKEAAAEAARLEAERTRQMAGKETFRCLVCKKVFQRPISKEPYVCGDACKRIYIQCQREKPVLCRARDEPRTIFAGEEEKAHR